VVRSDSLDGLCRISVLNVNPSAREARTPPPKPNSSAADTPEGAGVVVSSITLMRGAGSPRPVNFSSPELASRANAPKSPTPAVLLFRVVSSSLTVPAGPGTVTCRSRIFAPDSPTKRKVMV